MTLEEIIDEVNKEDDNMLTSEVIEKFKHLDLDDIIFKAALAIESSPWTIEDIELFLRKAKPSDVGNKDFFVFIGKAITKSAKVWPNLFKTIELLGRETVLRRFRIAQTDLILYRWGDL